MARKYHEIKGLAEFTAKMITSDEEQWKKFLHTAGHMYKYSNIGMNKINEMLRNPMCSFVLYVGAKKLVKRKEFEQFLAGRMEI